MRRGAVAAIVLYSLATATTAAKDGQDGDNPSGAPLTLIAPNGLPAPPPERPPVPARCPPLDAETMIEKGSAGPLPKINADGCMPWLAHAATFNHRETRPRVGIIVVDLGRDGKLTERAIDMLPSRVSLGFAPDAPFLGYWIGRARARGHEALVMLPVAAPGKPFGSFRSPLRADLPDHENLRRLHAVLTRAGTGYIGVIVPTTTPLSVAEPALRPLLKEIGERGLLVLETFRTNRTVHRLTTELGVPYSADAGWIDRKPDAAEIFANLVALEKFTKRNGFALAVATARPETIERLIEWSKELESHGLALAPVTALSDCLGLCAERVRKAFHRDGDGKGAP